MFRRLIGRIIGMACRDGWAGLSVAADECPPGCGWMGSGGKDVARRMMRMAAVFGASRAASLAEDWRREEMAANCKWCDARRACRIAQRRTDLRPQDVSFCPNTDNYRVLAAQCGIKA